MSSVMTPSDTYQSGQTSALSILEHMRGGTVPHSSVSKQPLPWRKIIDSLRQLSVSEVVMRIDLAASATSEMPTVLKPTPREGLFSSPLFQVAGIFEIDEPRWADRHDEYITETYL